MYTSAELSANFQVFEVTSVKIHSQKSVIINTFKTLTEFLCSYVSARLNGQKFYR